MINENLEPRLPSLRTSTWRSICGIAAVNLVSATAVYYLTALVFDTSFLPIAASITVTTLITLTLGRKLADRVSAPISAVRLAIKTLERTPSAGVTENTGTEETNEVLRCFARSSRQMHVITSLMEKVAAGRTDDLELPPDSPDRLTASFRSLVARVADSVDAKRDLDSIRLALAELADALRRRTEESGSLPAASVAEVAEIAELFDHSAALAAHSARRTHDELREIQSLVLSAMISIRNGMQTAEASEQALARAAAVLRSTADPAIPLEQSVASAAGSADQLGPAFADMQTASLGLVSDFSALQGCHNETGRRLRKVRERLQAVSTRIRSVDELSRRANLLSLNTTICAEDDRSLTALEFRELSEQADRVHRDLLAAERSLEKELDDVETLLQGLVTDTSALQITIRSVCEPIAAFGSLLNSVAALGPRSAAVIANMRAEREELTRILTAGHFDIEKLRPQLRESEAGMLEVRGVVDRSLAESGHAFPQNGPVADHIAANAEGQA